MKGARTLSLCLVAVGASVASWPNGPGGDPAPPAVNVPMYRGEPNGDDAAVMGTLVQEHDCLLLQADGGEIMQVAFP